MQHEAARLFEYHVWANDRLFTHLEQLPEEVLHAEVTSVFPSVSHTLGHIYLFDRLYLEVLSQVPNEEIFPKMSGWTAETQGRSLPELRGLFAAVAEEYRELLKRTPDPDRKMTITHPRHGSLDTRFSDILRHVVNHGTYHRGNITAILRQQGHPGVPTDYLFYLMDNQ